VSSSFSLYWSCGTLASLDGSLVKKDHNGQNHSQATRKRCNGANSRRRRMLATTRECPEQIRASYPSRKTPMRHSGRMRRRWKRPLKLPVSPNVSPAGQFGSGWSSRSVHESYEQAREKRTIDWARFRGRSMRRINQPVCERRISYRKTHKKNRQPHARQQDWMTKGWGLFDLYGERCPARRCKLVERFKESAYCLFARGRRIVHRWHILLLADIWNWEASRCQLAGRLAILGSALVEKLWLKKMDVSWTDTDYRYPAAASVAS